MLSHGLLFEAYKVPGSTAPLPANKRTLRTQKKQPCLNPILYHVSRTGPVCCIYIGKNLSFQPILELAKMMLLVQYPCELPRNVRSTPTRDAPLALHADVAKVQRKLVLLPLVVGALVD